MIHRQGGSILGVSRGPRAPSDMVDGLLANGVNSLIVIGGDGTLRGTPATANDSVFCTRLGQQAVLALMAGCTDAVVAHWSDRFTLVPTPVATAHRQRVDQETSPTNRRTTKAAQEPEPGSIRAGAAATSRTG